jgi:hypothetical protein
MLKIRSASSDDIVSSSPVVGWSSSDVVGWSSAGRSSAGSGDGFVAVFDACGVAGEGGDEKGRLSASCSFSSSMFWYISLSSFFDRLLFR